MSVALARELVMSYGWNATACQILNPGIDYWFSSAIEAVVGYTRRNSLLAVAGAPVCAPELLPAACAEFEAYARGQGCVVCYICAEDRLRVLLEQSPDHATVVLGAQPAWDPRTWTRIVQGNASLRAQLSRSRNKGVAVECVPPGQAAASPELRRILREWLQARSLPPMHFLVEPHVLDGVVDDRVVLVARRHAEAVAFLVASPIVAKNGYLVELLARSPSAPNGTGELLIDAAMQRFAGEDRRYVTLGLVALAHAVDKEMRRNPWWLRAAMQFARAHANRFYSFRGLEQFRLKMRPERWEPIYAISNEEAFSLRTLYNLGGAFSGISPWRAIGIGIARAVREELKGLDSLRRA
jgi:phosphatidylglycerol lysyltransferase